MTPRIQARPLIAGAMLLLLAFSLRAAAVIDEWFQSAAQSAPVSDFSAYGGNWKLEADVLSGQGQSGPKLIHNELQLQEGEVGVDMLLPSSASGNAGLIVRVNEPGVGADRFNGYEIALDLAAQQLLLGRHRQNFESVQRVPLKITTNQWFSVVVALAGNVLEVRVNGTTIVHHVEQAGLLPGGAVGLRPWQCEARYRNLWVKTNGTHLPIAFKPLSAPADDMIFPGWKRWVSESQGAEQGTLPHAGFRLVTNTGQNDIPHQHISFADGAGEVGIVSQSVLPCSKLSGFILARASVATRIFISAPDSPAAAETDVLLLPGGWQRLGFRLPVTRADQESRLAIKLKGPGAVDLARVYAEPQDSAWHGSLATANLPEILFLKRGMLSSPPAVGCDIWSARPLQPGCAIAVFDPAQPEITPRTIFSDPGGSIYDLNLSLDGRTVFFSYTPPGEKYWHLWRIDVSGRGLEQITDGPFYDVSPCELPDGDLAFVSTRRFGHTVCQPGPASNLYRVAPRRGATPHCMSMNTLSDTTPQLLPDGRLLFMRWEYVDRDLTFRQSLWTQRPDGTGYQLYFGNTVRDPGSFMQARPVPGRSDRVLATFAPHHGYPHGAIGWIEPARGPEMPRGQGFDWITREFPTIGDQAHPWSYRDPFPLDSQTFLCAYGGGGRQRYRIYLHDSQDRRRLLFEDSDFHCFFPIPLRSQPRPSIPVGALAAGASTTRLPEEHLPEDQPMATCLLVNVYDGLGPAIQRGRVKYIRIMEQVRKTEDIPASPHTLDFGPRAYDQSPLMSYATYYAKRCWGIVPVEEDGSAYFKVPALREIYFQACDAEGRELQRMTSAAQLMPGETLGCAGCHEPRTAAPPHQALPLAAKRPPTVPTPPDWAPDGFIDFVSVVQPVLDRHCVRCHSGPNPDGGYDLSGDKTRFFNMAYDNLLGRSHSYRQHKMDTGEMLPAEAAKGKPLVHFYWLLQTPTAVNQPLWTGTHASRLPDYLTEQHCGSPVPLADRQRIYTWIDANVPYYATYASSRSRAGGKRDLCADPVTGEPARWFKDKFLPVYNRRCADCHGEFHLGRLVTCWDGRTAWINFTRPENSPALTAHLPKPAGRGIQRTAEGKSTPGFPGVNDPDYQTMLQAIQTGALEALAVPGPDMPGFQFSRKEP